MDVVRVSATSDLFDRLAQFKRDTRWKFRGQADSDWPLAPKAARSAYVHYDDKKSFRQWERGAIQHLELGKLSIWERLAVAQHHGMATRLLDWSHNPLVACFFAANELPEKDAAVYALRVKRRTIDEQISPFDMTGVIKYYQPNVSSQRMANQLGHFTAHCPPDLALSETNTRVRFGADCPARRNEAGPHLRPQLLWRELHDHLPGCSGPFASSALVDGEQFVLERGDA